VRPEIPRSDFWSGAGSSNADRRASKQPWIAALIFVIVADLTVFMSGQQGGRIAAPANNLQVPILSHGPQESPGELPGVVDDWSHHRLIFSNPGSEEEALREGRHDGWLRVVNEPRYIMQQLKRHAPAQGPAAEYVAAMNEQAREQETAQGEDMDTRQAEDSFRRVKDPRPVRPAKAEVHRDWSMSLGSGAKVGAGTYPTKFSFSTSTAICAGTSQQPDFIVFNNSLVGAVSANLTETVSGSPNNGANEMITIVNGSNTLTLHATPVVASASGTISGEPSTNSTLTIKGNGNTLIIQASSSTSSSCTYASNSSTVTFARSTSTTTDASRVAGLIATTGCGSVVGVTASNNSSATLTITATTAGIAGDSITVQTTSGFDIAAWTTATNLGNGADASSSGTNFTTSPTPGNEAQNIAAAVNINGSSVGVSATYNSSGAVTISATAAGTGGNSISAASTVNNFSFSSANLANGANPQASIIAYDNLYSSCTSGGSVPSVYWQYDTSYVQGSTVGDGSKITTSPVLFWDGTQVAFVQSNSSNQASLLLLRWKANSSLVSMNTSTNNVTPASYPSCTAPCMTRITFSGTTTPNDTNSAPFYDYENDIIYVGDDSGALHKFHPAFNGTPTEVTGGSPAWPVSVSSNVLTSPVYDISSKNIFIADSGGFLYSYPAAGGTLLRTSKLASTGGQGIVDAPLVDSASNVVYAWVGYDGNTSTSHNCDATGCAGVFRFSTTLGTSGTGL